MSTNSIVEHIVLFKIKEDTEPSKLTAMINGLNSLNSVDQVLYLTVGPLLHNRSTSLTFTHILHSRYKSKQDLESYSAHPSHVSAVKENAPIIDDIMAVDWIAEDLNGADLVQPHGSAIRVTFFKLKKENEVSDEVLKVIKEIPGYFKQISQLSFGENFSPARAKGYSIASLAVFPGLSELEEVDWNHELVNFQKDKVRDCVDSVVAVDFVVPPPPSPQSASL